MNLSSLNTEIFEISHLSDCDLEDISSFTIKNPNGHGLEMYLKYSALADEKSGAARTYIIRDTMTHKIVAYFSLKTGLITAQTSLTTFDNLSAIELANFAVNDDYRMYNDVIPQVGKYIFYVFILPLAKEISQYVGASYLYIFALPQNKLMAHYKTMGFKRFSKSTENFIHRHIRPNYDQGCIFMYQSIADS